MHRELSGRKEPLDPRGDSDAIAALELKAIAVRRFILELGLRSHIRLHYGAIMSVVEILTLLYDRWMTVDPVRPGWELRDRFILSKGHAAPTLYVVLSLAGYFARSEFEGFRRIGSTLQGHPDRCKTPGVECSTGSLGQGFPSHAAWHLRQESMLPRGRSIPASATANVTKARHGKRL